MVKFLKHDFSASVLATVLVVSTLLLLGVLMVIELWNFDLVRYNLYHQGEQARANVESGFLLYSRDSTLSYRWEGDSSVLLFGQREDSRVRYSRQRWGMYEVVEVQNGRHRSVRLLGKKAESFWRATLYVPENNRAFSVTGRTFAESDVYLPRNGISYTQLRSEFFKGRALDKKQIKTSEERLPPLDEESRDVVNGLLDYAGEREWLENGSVLQRGFREPVVRVEVGEYLSGVRVSGPVILYASSMLFVEENNRLENVIIVGDRVEFAERHHPFRESSMFESRVGALCPPRGRKGIYSLGGGVRGKRIRDRGSESERGGTETALVLSTGVFPGAGIVVRGRYSGGSRVRDG